MLPWLIDRTSFQDSYGTFFDGGGTEGDLPGYGHGCSFPMGSDNPKEECGADSWLCDGVGTGQGSGHGRGHGHGEGMGSEKLENIWGYGYFGFDEPWQLVIVPHTFLLYLCF